MSNQRSSCAEQWHERVKRHIKGHSPVHEWWQCPKEGLCTWREPKSGSAAL